MYGVFLALDIIRNLTGMPYRRACLKQA
jgi:hypothetical protein